MTTYLTNRQALEALLAGKPIELQMQTHWIEGSGGRIDVTNLDALSPYRLAAETVTITATFPKPETVAPNAGARYWVADFTMCEWCLSYVWVSDATDNRYLKRGLVHLTEDAAVAHAKALCGVME